MNHRIFPIDLTQTISFATAILGEYWRCIDSEIFHRLNIPLDVNCLQKDRENLQKYSLPYGYFLFAGVDRKVVGCVGVTGIGDGIGEIQRLHVNPAYRQQGIGRSLLETIVDQSRQMGYAQLHSISFPFLSSAHSLYGLMGFQVIGKCTDWEYLAEEDFHPVLMELTL